MAKSNLRMLLYKLLAQSRGRKAFSNKGFTLIELLISLVIAGIVVSGLLFVVVELLRVDQREVALDQVQSDMQRAMDYIADDLQEAIYVYEDPATVTAQLDTMNDEVTDGSVPVIAFWRTDEVDVLNDTALPADCTSEGANEDACVGIKLRRASYTLVAYYQKPRNPALAWEGESAIKRYELAQYENLNAAGAAKYNLTAGYTLPLSDGGTGDVNDFVNWTASTAADGGNTNVLADYVDYVAPADRDGSLPVVNCQAYTGDAAHVLVPADATEETGFFACIRPAVEAGGFRTNQDVFVFLRGDATAASRFLQPASEGSRLPLLQTQIRLNGQIDKQG